MSLVFHTLALVLCLGVKVNAERYHHSVHHLQLDYNPLVWQLIPNSKMVHLPSASKTLLSLQLHQPDQMYHTSFAVVSDTPSNTEGNFKEKYYNNAVKFLRNQRFKTTSHFVRLKGIKEPVYEIIAYQTNLNLTFRQIIVFREKVAYLLTAASLTSAYEARKKFTGPLFNSVSFSKTVSKTE